MERMSDTDLLPDQAALARSALDTLDEVAALLPVDLGADTWSGSAAVQYGTSSTSVLDLLETARTELRTVVSVLETGPQVCFV